MASKSDVLQDLLWTEKYRPMQLEDLALEKENHQVLKAYLDAGEIPHLLLLGPAGSGKTTIARILINALDCVSLNLNASSERGIDTVRERIGTFVTAMTAAQWNIVFLDEFDAMTSDAQTALRNLMESYADRARFILTANYGHRIIGPIQSRCQVLTFGRPPLPARTKVLLKVLAAEGIVPSPNVAMEYAHRFPDLRQMLFVAQKAFLGTGGKELPPAAQAGPVTGADLFLLLTRKDWTAFRTMTTQGDFDPQQAMREMFWAVPDNHARAGKLRHVLARGVHECGFTPDIVILFLGVVSEAMDAL